MELDLKQNLHISNQHPCKLKPILPIFGCKGCSNYRLLGFNNPLVTQKHIQKVVGIDESLYTMNVGALSSFDSKINPLGVNWNQMSDRSFPHVQHANNGTNSVKHSITLLRPSALSAGGTGVDIKHNFYGRHLNRIKGKGYLKGKQKIAAIPIMGNKTTNLGIISSCNCNNA